MESTHPSSPRVLLVEDEPKLVRSLTRGLEEAGYVVVSATTGEEGLHLATTETFDVAVLDWMLPGLSGLELLDELRRSNGWLPTLFLTARDTVEDRVQGLDVGADDYLVKPFAFDELLARLRALLRRGRPSTEELHVGDLKLDPLGRCVSRDGQLLELSTREFELLEYLMRHAGETVTRETLARDVWREPEPGLTNVIDVYINYLRKKLERSGSPRLIQTVRGVGYLLRGDS